MGTWCGLKAATRLYSAVAPRRRSIAEAHGVQATVVPGISSAIAVPASANIPVTARGVSESFWVITGTTKAGDISTDVALAAQSKATVVILMGLNKLADMLAQFSKHGKGDVPAAVIFNGTLPDQRNVIGTVSTLPALAEAERIRLARRNYSG